MDMIRINAKIFKKVYKYSNGDLEVFRIVLPVEALTFMLADKDGLYAHWNTDNGCITIRLLEKKVPGYMYITKITNRQITVPKKLRSFEPFVRGEFEIEVYKDKLIRICR